MTDANICECGWTEAGDNLNPHREQCPECGGEFFEREEIRWFGVE
jgi:hypothetical protein